MARPSKGTVDYFPHYIKSGKTLFVLENDFGNDGYAFWFKLLEVLAGTNGMTFDYNDTANVRFLLSKSRIDENKCLKIIETLVVLGAIDKKLWESKRIIWVENLVENVKDAFKKRINSVPQKPEVLGVSECVPSINVVSVGRNSNNEQFPYVETTNKVHLPEFLPEESGKGKEREIKGKEIKVEVVNTAATINPFRLFESEGFGTISSLIADRLGHMIDEYGERWTCEAMKLAVFRGKRNLGYVDGILKSFQSSGIDEPWNLEKEEQAKGSDPPHSKNSYHKQQNKGFSGKPRLPIVEDKTPAVPLSDERREALRKKAQMLDGGMNGL